MRWSTCTQKCWPPGPRSSLQHRSTIAPQTPSKTDTFGIENSSPYFDPPTNCLPDPRICAVRTRQHQSFTRGLPHRPLHHQKSRSSRASTRSKHGEPLCPSKWKTTPEQLKLTIHCFRDSTLNLRQLPEVQAYIRHWDPPTSPHERPSISPAPFRP